MIETKPGVFVRTADTIFGTTEFGQAVDDTTPPNLLMPTVELPVYGVRPADRKWWIDSLISQLDNGQFQNAGRLGDGIKRDARIMAALEQRNAGLFSAPLELLPSRVGLKPDDKDSQQAIDIRDEIMAGWDRMFPRCELEELNQYGIIQGIGIAEKIWDTTKRPWTFTVDVRHPQFYLWLWNTGNYHLITQNRSLIRVPRRSAQFINFAPYGYKRGYLNGRLRALVDPWMMRQWDKNDWASWCEQLGHPIKKAIVPQQADPKQERDFVNAIANLGSNTTIKTRQDKDGNKYDVELVESMGMNWTSFESFMKWCDEEISNVLLGQSMSMDGQSGLGSDVNAGGAVRDDIKQADSLKLCEALYTQGLREYCEYNYGNADLAPMPQFMVTPPEDESKNAATDLSIGQALVAFKASGAPIDVRSFLEQRGYPMLTEAEEAAQKAQAMEEAQQMAALTKPEPEEEDESDPKKLHMVSEAMKNFRLAGSAVDDSKILTRYGVPHVDSED